MKTSTLLSMAMISVSCYAAPLHTGDIADGPGNDAVAARAALALRANAAPVAPPAPDVLAQAIDHARWSHVALPKSRTPSHGAISQKLQVQT